MPCRISDRNDWFDLFVEDKRCMIAIMAENMACDLAAGYDYFGKAMTESRKELEEYKAQFDREMDMFKTMDEKSVNRWCFYDLKKRGAIL